MVYQEITSSVNLQLRFSSLPYNGQKYLHRPWQHLQAIQLAQLYPVQRRFFCQCGRVIKLAICYYMCYILRSNLLSSHQRPACQWCTKLKHSPSQWTQSFFNPFSSTALAITAKLCTTEISLWYNNFCKSKTLKYSSSLQALFTLAEILNHGRRGSRLAGQPEQQSSVNSPFKQFQHFGLFKSRRFQPRSVS